MTGYNVCNFESIFEYPFYTPMSEPQQLALIKRLEKARAASATETKLGEKTSFDHVLRSCDGDRF